MKFNVTPLIISQINNATPPVSIEGAYVNVDKLLQYDLDVEADTDEMLLAGVGQQGQEYFQMRVNSAGANVKLTDAGNEIVNVALIKATVKQKDARVLETPSEMAFSNVMVVLDRSTADNEADFYAIQESRGRANIVHYVVDTSSETVPAIFQKADLPVLTLS